MAHKSVYWLETFILLAGAGIMLIVGVIQLPDWLPAGVLKRPHGIAQAAVLMAVVLLVMGSVSFWRLRKNHDGLFVWLFNEIKQFPALFYRQWSSLSNFSSHNPAEMVGLSAIILLGVAVRLPFMNQPMRGDEAYTFMGFVNEGVVRLFDYFAPNNHVFHSVLVFISTSVFGGHPFDIRLPAFLAGLGVIGASFWLGRSISGEYKLGFVSALASAVLPYLILYSTNARGYTLVLLISLGLGLLVIKMVEQPTFIRNSLFILLTALGLWTMPATALPLAGIFIWLLALMLVRGKSWHDAFLQVLFPIGVGVVIFTILLYLPVIVVANGVELIINNKFVAPQAFSDLPVNLMTQFQKVGPEFFRDIPGWFLVSAAGLTLFGNIVALRKRDWTVGLLLPALLLGATLVIILQRVVPYSRTLMYFLPFLFVVMGYGLASLTRTFSPLLQQAINWGMFVAGVIFCINLVVNDVVTRYPDTSAFRGAPQAVLALKPIITQQDRIRISPMSNWSIYYYFWYYDVPYPPGDNDQGNIYYIVKTTINTIDDITDRPVIKLYEYDDMQLYQFKK